MKPNDSISWLLTCLGFGLMPVCALAADRQEIQIQQSVKAEQRAGLVTTAPWESLTPEVSAQAWNLELAEWEHYRKLMQGPARFYAADMPPPMVLAMYADTDFELNHYAEKLAQYERDRNDRILKVQRAYDAAMNRLYPNEKIIDLSLLQQQGISPTTQSSVPGIAKNPNDNRTPRFGDKLALFASPECTNCVEKIQTITAKHAIAPLEVYFSGDSSTFKEWIRKSKIQPEWFKQHGVTFALDEGQSEQYKATPGTVFIVRDHALLEMMQ